MAKPKLLLDENIGNVTANILRSQGYDIVSISEISQGVDDEKVIKESHEGQRILVTLDKDFGALVFLYSKKHVGVVLLRLVKESAEMVAHVLLSVLEHHGAELEGSFTVASEQSVRIRKSA